jgi:periplasmic protein TonB
MSATARHFTSLERPAPGRGSYALGFMVALGMHAAILFCWPKAKVLMEQVEFGVEAADSSVEVSLVAALPAEQPTEVVETPEPPPPEPPPPEPPKPEPPPPPVIMPEKPPEVTVPEPEPAPEPKPTPPPRQIQKPKPQKPAKPKPVARASGDGSSEIPGNDATTARASAGALGAKPSYLRNPHPSYPEDARAAGQQGTVMLHVKVDENGRVLSVRITRSSGFPSLDERARSTVAGQWSFKPAKAGGVAVTSEVVIPIQFTLNK